MVEEVKKTAFVFAGGGSLGAIQVGMLRALTANGVTADMVVGSSVGAINGAYYAGAPTAEGVERLAEIWLSLRREDVFPVTWRTILSFLLRRDFLVPPDGMRWLVDTYLPFLFLFAISKTPSSPCTWSRRICCRAAPSCCPRGPRRRQSWRQPLSRLLFRP